MKKGLNKNAKEKTTISQKVKQCLTKARKWLENAKELITKNKKTALVGGVATILLAVLGITAMFQTTKNTQNATDPELARAMNYEQVQEGEEKVEGTENVKFDAFFLRDINNDGYAESIRGTCKEIGKEDTLYMELNVQTAGYLKDAKITVDGKNFYLQTTLPKDEQLQDNYIGSNIKEIKFNQLRNGTQKMLTGIVRSGDYSYNSTKASAIGTNINNYSQVNSITLTGTYVDEVGRETEISKTVNFNIDWYGTTRARIYTTTQNRNIENAIKDQEGTINLDFTVYTEELDQRLNLQTNHVEAEIPELNGYAPIDVIYTGSNATANYNPETKLMTIDRTAEVAEDGKITNGMGRTNSYDIRAIYPIEAYQALGTESVQLRVPVKTYYEGFNNSNLEFKNPYKSNIPQATIIINYTKPVEQTYSTTFDVTVGKYVYDPSYHYMVSKQKPLKIYNGESEQEKDDIYTVMWKGYVGTNANTDGMTMKEVTGDQFIKTDSTQESMEEVSANIGIYFTGAETLLGENGWIKVYDDETGDLLQTFTKDNWNQYNTSNPYKYAIPVKHVRIETSEIVKKETSLYVYHLKEINDEKITTKYERSQFDQLQYIKASLAGFIAGEQIASVTHQAYYEAPMSIAEIKISKNTISTQGTEKNDRITIETRATTSNNQVPWQNGTFLVKLPTEVIDVKLNEVSINNQKVRIENYEVIQENGQNFIKIVTKNDTPQTYTITLDVDLSADPRIATTTKSIELYATNENGSDYYYKAADIYDVNNNLNTEEIVNHTTTSLSMVSPNSLLTNQTATNFDNKESTVISPQVADVKPNYAVVDYEHEQEEQTATIGVQIKNNYASTISDICLLGKIPFRGNTYVISGADLGSSFTTKMTNEGIGIPQELAEIATIYYSENETPDKERTKEENGWKTKDQVENWDNIKTFLIDLGDYVMPTGKEFLFNYVVKIPNGLEFNQVAYSHHGVYFSLDTENGKYKTKTEPNKLGFRIAEKYELNLTKYQTAKEKKVPGAAYSFQEIIKNEDGSETTGEAKTAVTNAEGTLKITNLYAEKIYEIKEIKTPDDYELNEDAIRFIAHVNEHGVLTIEKLQGNPKGEIQVTKNEGENYQVNIAVEDEVKASLKITKKEQGSEIKIPQVRYKLTGYGMPQNGKTITTNLNGEANLKGLKIGEEYTLQEVKAEGYYLASPIKFRIVNNEGNYVLEEIEEIKENNNTEGETTEETTSQANAIVTQETTEADGIPTISIVLEDEKIPTYDLEITKIKKTTGTTLADEELMAKAEGNLAGTEVTYLAGAKFKLYKGTEEIGEYITDSTGKIQITGLYQFENSKNIDQTYTLKEVLAPEGYAKVKDITFKVEKEGEELKFQEEETEGATKKQYQVEGNTIKLTIEDSPSFRLLKKDAETKLPIANVKFAIYNVDDGEKPATNSKGETIGTLETINGKAYYTVTTNENGEITADLTEGLYKAVELQAEDQYDIENQTHYFGVGTSREGKKVQTVEWAKGIGGSESDAITSVVATSDGGYIVGGYFKSNEIDLGNGIILTNNNAYRNGMLIKYTSKGECEWAKGIEGYGSEITSIEETQDGGYIVGGYFYGIKLDLGNGIELSNNGKDDGMIIKYNAEGECDWAKGIGGSKTDRITSVAETQDGEYIVGGYFQSDQINLGNGIILKNYNTSGILIKYDVKGEIEWAKEIRGENGYERIEAVTRTGDGGVIVGGYFESGSIDLGNGISLTKQTKGEFAGMIIKYNREGEVEWAKSINTDINDTRIFSVVETNDGGIIAGGDFSGKEINLGNGITLSNNGKKDGMIIKYNAEGECEWAKGIGGSESDAITSVEATNDGGYVIGGDFTATIDLENGIRISSRGNSDGMIIKCNSEGNVEWAKEIGGTAGDYINSATETQDGKYVIGGYFYSSLISLENGENLVQKGTSGGDGILAQYKPGEIPEVVTKQAKGIGGNYEDAITSVSKTTDGGYIAGGYFKSNEIDLGNRILLNQSVSREYGDGMLIKYNKEGEAQWTRKIGGNGDEAITLVAEAQDGGYIVGGYASSSIVDLENGVKLRTKESSLSYTQGIVIKYSKDGEVEWARAVGQGFSDKEMLVTQTKDGAIIIVVRW